MSSNAYTLIIGLEVHVQLLTQSKLFCPCSTKFGTPPNTQTCPVCAGFPGTLPVMNARAFELSLRTAAALNCEIAPRTKWDRKQYYYPDLPKGYQISQYDLPFSHDGWVEITEPKQKTDAKQKVEPKRIRIIRAHLEEDAGKSMHDEATGQADSRIDLNRAGTPLLEIVTQPDLRSPAEAKIFLTELRLLLTYLGVSDCNMQEGSLRVDANVNLHVAGEGGETIATPIVEIKNMNSFRSVERALAYEEQRLWNVWEETGQRLGQVPKQTRGWDDEAGVTRAQRHKEESSDYRYFPDPDLVPVTVTEAKVAEVVAALGELPAALRQRLEKTYGISAYDSDVLVNQGRTLVEYYIAVAEACGDGKVASNWMQQDVLRTMKEQELTIESFPVSATALGELLKKVKAGDIDTTRGREVLADMVAHGRLAEESMKALGIERVDESALIALCEELVAANPKVVEDVKAGKLQAAGTFVGAAKKKNPNVNPARVREICLEIIARK
jgi:aspartyl-tRNA(Asn)/glutamyl-tRNA(Gln) amidotransferase subunit B